MPFQPKRLPCEDLDSGLYIHPGSARVTAITTLREADDRRAGWREEATYYVHAEDFMAMQRERDGYRRTLALVNEVLTCRHDEGVAIKLIREAGFSADDARAMAGVIREVLG